MIFDGFQLDYVQVAEVTLRVRHGGSGPPVLLLHGHPRTHTTWYRVAPLLARNHTVVCPDLRGFGRSSKPQDAPDHAGSSKRAKAQDCIALMKHLGFDRFAIVGHDRGSYTAFRAALDHPDAISHLAILDGVPILKALERCTEKFARLWWHWFFFAQPGKPERAILADPEAWYGGDETAMGAENFADYHCAIRDPATVHSMIEDYRAGLAIDRFHDEADRSAGNKVKCPALCLWSERDDLEILYEDVLEVWRPWCAAALRGRRVDSGHHMAEETPEELAHELKQFLNN